jgi:ectoine hydroxylase-related dioxygenase (phytanoyl-CoA dioxygenase family)
MKTELTQTQVDQYQQQGYIVIEGFLSAAELEHWRAVTADAIQMRLANSQNLSNQADPDAFYAQVFTQCLRLADIHPGMAELIFDADLGRMASTLAGVDGIRIWHDQALVKPPYGNHTAFHMDNPFWSFHSKQAISIWVALDDATLANGCLWYLPGTQLEATYESTGIGENLGGIFKAYPQWKRRQAVPAACPAGSAVFHNGLIAHGAGANMTPYPRRAMTCAYMPDGSTFNGIKNVLPDDYYASLKVGDLLNNNRINRLVWHKAGRHRASTVA